uniref:hypothetical protein n=1 Tax=Faecalibaculum rodentium TaxID=1702221 RepID=UPI00260FE991
EKGNRESDEHTGSGQEDKFRCRPRMGRQESMEVLHIITTIILMKIPADRRPPFLKVAAVSHIL